MVTTVDLLKRIKSATLTPTHQITFTDTDILSLADEEIDNLLIPHIMSLREEYFVKMKEVTIAIGVDTIEIPERAVGRTIRELKLMGTDNTRPYSLSRASITEEYALSTTPGKPIYHYFQGDSIRVNPIPDQAYGNYHLWYEEKPSRLVLTTDVGIITAVSDTTVTVQQNLNKLITTGAIVDIIKVKAGYVSLYIDQVIGTISTGLGPKIITLAGFSALNPITGVSVGDHISLAYTTDIVQLPDEAIPVLVQAVAMRILQSQSQTEQYQIAEKLLARNLESLSKALTPRNEGSSFKIRCHSPAFGPGRRFSVLGSSSN